MAFTLTQQDNITCIVVIGAPFSRPWKCFEFLSPQCVFYPFLSSSHRFHINSSIFFFCGFVHKNFYFVRICPLVVDSFICCLVDSTTTIVCWEVSSSCYGFVHLFCCGFVHVIFYLRGFMLLLWFHQFFCCGFVHTIFYLRGFVLLLWITPFSVL